MKTKTLAEQYNEAADYLWKFVSSTDEHSAFMDQYKGEYKLLIEKLDEYLNKILELHCKSYDIKDFKTVYLDNIGVCCDNYSEKEICSLMSFTQMISHLYDMQSQLKPEAIKEYCVSMFGDEFEQFTDGESKESIYTSEKYKEVLLKVKEQVELQVEYNDFIDDVRKFELELHDLLACVYYEPDSIEHKIVNEVVELFDKYVQT